MAQGHMIPMMDIARILASHGLTITVVTTPLNAARFQSVVSRAIASGLSINVVQVEFPTAEAGLPHGCETFDMVTSMEMTLNFFKAANLLEKQVEALFNDLKPRPSCLIADMGLYYTDNLAKKFNVPKIVFHGMSCFCLLCTRIARASKIFDTVASESEYFVLPDFPDKIDFTKAQIPADAKGEWADITDRSLAADNASYGVIINTFHSLEPAYVKQYKKERSDKVWCFGPVSLCNKDGLDIAERGNKATVDEVKCMRWLDSQETNSVVYVCLGSLCNLLLTQLIELGLGLEASNKPFVWVVRDWEKEKGFKQWISDTEFEDRVKDRGVLIKGWAPQVLILSHPSIGGFLTHCGWNSTLEGITAGVPLLTWPLFGDQFCNDKLVVQVLKVGVPIGVEQPMKWGEEEKVGVMVNRDNVKSAVDKVMDKGEEGENRRRRAKELAESANRAVEEGGSSYMDITMLIKDISTFQQTENKI